MTISSISTNTLPSANTKLDKAHADLKKAAQGFESYFVDQMLKEMRKSIPKDDFLGDSDHQQEIFQDMSDQAVADNAAKTGSFGIANSLYQELSKSLPPNNPLPDTSTLTKAVVPGGNLGAVAVELTHPTSGAIAPAPIVAKDPKVIDR